MHQRSNHQPSATKAFAQSAGAKLLIIAVNAATGIVTARALAPSGRGELAVMILWYTLLASSFTLGLPSALTYQLRREPEQRSNLVGAALLLSIVLSTLISGVAFFALPLWMPQYSAHIQFFARVFLFNTPIAAFLLIGRAAVESEGNFRASNLSLVGPPALTFVALAVLWGMHRLTPVSAAWAYVPAGLPAVIALGITLHRHFRPSVKDFIASSRRLLSYGFRSYGIDLCGTMSLYVDQALVVHILKPDMMGTYVVALSLSRMLNAFHTAAVMVLFPKAVSRPPAEVLALTGRTVRLTTLLTVLSGGAIMLAGPKLLAVLYGAEYQNASTILRILIVEVVIAGATQVLSQAFMALGRPGVVTALQAIGLSLTIPLMVVLVPRFGIRGAAASLLISTCIRFAFVMSSFSRFLSMPRPKVLFGRADFRYVRSIAEGRLGLSGRAAEVRI